MSPNSIDCIVTDPPYELGFMGKSWDSQGVAFQASTWKKCWDALKPGGYLLAFGGSRTFHRIACAIEDAGFEIRDTIMWLYGSGFPKSMNIGLAIDKKSGTESKIVGMGKSGAPSSHQSSLNMARDFQSGVYEFGGEYSIKKATNEWAAWGTSLKPSYEPIIIARKPCEGTCVDNVLKYGVGGLNIDECRIGDDPIGAGRFPANTIFTYDDTDFDEVCGGLPSGSKNGSITKRYDRNNQVYGDYGKCDLWESYNDSGSAVRYFYCAKASKRDRDEGLENFEVKTKVFNGKSSTSSAEMKDVEERFTTMGRNTHPTVKPTSLMQYLVRLVAPKGATILDPFMGSGSTGKAVMYENNDRDADYKFIGIELTEEYLPIAKARILYASGDTAPVDNTCDKTAEESAEDLPREQFKRTSWGI